MLSVQILHAVSFAHLVLAPAVLRWLSMSPHRHLFCTQLQPTAPVQASGLRLRPILSPAQSQSSASTASPQQQQQQQQQQALSALPPELAQLLEKPEGRKALLGRWAEAQATTRQPSSDSSKADPLQVLPCSDTQWQSCRLEQVVKAAPLVRPAPAPAGQLFGSLEHTNCCPGSPVISRTQAVVVSTAGLVLCQRVVT